MKSFKIKILIVVGAIILILLVYRAPFWYQQWRYRQFFKKHDICFAEGYSGNGSSWYGFDAYKCSSGYAHDPKPFPVGAAPASQSPKMTFVDIDGDGIPEIHVSGYDSANPGWNFTRYNEKTKKLEAIPPENVPRQWKDRYPEDQNH